MSAEDAERLLTRAWQIDRLVAEFAPCCATIGVVGHHAVLGPGNPEILSKPGTKFNCVDDLVSGRTVITLVEKSS